MTLANKITLTRIALIPVLVILMTIGGQGCMIASLVLFLVTSATDFLDGYVARKYNQVTDFGKFVDPLADKLLVTAALCLFVEQSLIAGGLVWIILAREFIITSLRTCWGLSLQQLRSRFGTRLYDYCLKMAAPHIARGHLTKKDEDVLVLTEQGIFISDGIMSDLLWVE